MADVVEEEEEEDYEDEDGAEHEGHQDGHAHQQHAQHAQHAEYPDVIQEEEEEDEEDEQHYEEPDREHGEDALQARPRGEAVCQVNEARQAEGRREEELRLQKEARDAESALVLPPSCSPT